MLLSSYKRGSNLGSDMCWSDQLMTGKKLCVGHNVVSIPEVTTVGALSCLE